MSSLTGEGAILTGRLFPDLLDYLHVRDIKHHLLSVNAINREEYEQLQVGQSPHITTERSLADKLVMLLSRKPDGASQLLQALERSVSSDNPQIAHHQLIQKLREELDECSKLATDGPVLPPTYQLQHSPLLNGTENGLNRELPHQSSVDSAIESFTDLIPNPGKSNEPVALVRYKPYLESQEHEKLRVHLTTESQSILEEFTSFVLDVGVQLRYTSTDPEDVKLALVARLGKDIDERKLQQIDEASAVTKLQRISMPFSSWYNYDLVAYLAKRYGGAKGVELVEAYEKHFESYLKKLVYTCPPVLSDDAPIPNGFQEIIVKVDQKFSDCTIQDITIFKGKLCKHLGIDDPTRFILRSVTEGCVRLSFLLPSHMAECTWARAVTAKAELARVKVTTLQMEGKTLNFKEGVPSPPEIVTDFKDHTPHNIGHHTTSPTTELAQRLLHLVSTDRQVFSPHAVNLHSPSAEKPSLSPLATHAMKAEHKSPDSSPLNTRRQYTEPRQVVLRPRSSSFKRVSSDSQRSSISDLGYDSMSSRRSSEDASSRRSSGFMSPSPVDSSRTLSDVGYSTPTRRASGTPGPDEHTPPTSSILEETLTEETANLHVDSD